MLMLLLVVIVIIIVMLVPVFFIVILDLYAITVFFLCGMSYLNAVMLALYVISGCNNEAAWYI